MVIPGNVLRVYISPCMEGPSLIINLPTTPWATGTRY